MAIRYNKLWKLLIDKEMMKKDFDFSMIKIIKKQSDKDVKKYLFELTDGNKIESVLMYHNYGISLCVSSQVGCNMGCKFCESGRLKKIRNLETYEIVEQLLLIEEDINLNKVPLDDKKVYDLFKEANTSGIFQFESDGMRAFLKKLKPELPHDAAIPFLGMFLKITIITATTLTWKD